MKTTTYLIGAGASAGNSGALGEIGCEGIPVVRQFNKDVQRFLDTVATMNNHHESKERFIRELKPIFDEMADHYSFDTYAKKLHLTRKTKELRNLKILLNTYLLYRQFTTIRDRRYDLFFATLISNEGLSPKINFVSYNYDLCIEHSLSSFSLDGKFDSFINRFPYTQGMQPDRSSLIKVNGSASMQREDGFDHLDLLFDKRGGHENAMSLALQDQIISLRGSWFTNWVDFEFGKELDAKNSQEVY